GKSNYRVIRDVPSFWVVTAPHTTRPHETSQVKKFSTTILNSSNNHHHPLSPTTFSQRRIPKPLCAPHLKLSFSLSLQWPPTLYVSTIIALLVFMQKISR